MTKTTQNITMHILKEYLCVGGIYLALINDLRLIVALVNVGAIFDIQQPATLNTAVG